MIKAMMVCSFALLLAGTSVALRGQTPAAEAAPSPQTPPPALPPGPILADLESAEWQVVTTRSGAAAQPPEKEPAKAGARVKILSTQNITKTGDIRLEVTTDENGGKATKWIVGGAEVSQTTGQPLMLLRGKANARKSSARPVQSPAVVRTREARPVDFPEVAWVSGRNFTGIAKIAGADCLTFKDRLSILSAGELNEAKGKALKAGQEFDEDSFKEPATACINLESRLPVIATRGKDTFTYKFLPEPAEPLAVPPEIEGLIKIEETRQQDLARLPARS